MTKIEDKITSVGRETLEQRLDDLSTRVEEQFAYIEDALQFLSDQIDNLAEGNPKVNIDKWAHNLKRDLSNE